MNSTHQRIHDTYLFLFDGQHAHAYNLMDLMERMIEEAAPKNEISLVLEGLLNQIREHFRSEEEMMALLDFKEEEGHKQEHDELLASLYEFLERYKTNALDVDLLELLALVKSKFTLHTDGTDKILDSYHVENYNFSGSLTEAQEMTVHVSIFDIQHKNIDFLIELLEKSLKNGEDKSYIMRLLFDLIEKLKRHFTHEEKLMRQYGFPLYDEHYQDHQEFLKLTAEIKRNFEQGHPEMSAIEMFGIIRTRVEEHIIKQDKQYGDFFNKLGIM